MHINNTLSSFALLRLILWLFFMKKTGIRHCQYYMNESLTLWLWENWADVFEDCGKFQSTPHLLVNVNMQCLFVLFIFFVFVFMWHLWPMCLCAWLKVTSFKKGERHYYILDTFYFIVFGRKKAGTLCIAMLFLPTLRRREKPYKLFNLELEKIKREVKRHRTGHFLCSAGSSGRPHPMKFCTIV